MMAGAGLALFRHRIDMTDLHCSAKKTSASAANLPPNAVTLSCL
jgi:hypothetical protein